MTVRVLLKPRRVAGDLVCPAEACVPMPLGVRVGAAGIVSRLCSGQILWSCA
jgi:hypothetical protein